jgi:predicted DNA-binding protein (UPF0251 family)
MEPNLDARAQVAPLVRELIGSDRVSATLVEPIATLTTELVELLRLVSINTITTKDFGGLVMIATRTAFAIVDAERNRAPDEIVIGSVH